MLIFYHYIFCLNTEYFYLNRINFTVIIKAMRPNYQSQKPEAALQRALEFISVGKEKDALQSLHDLIKVFYITYLVKK